MKIKIKEKTVKLYTIKLTEKELIGVWNDLVDVVEIGDASGSMPDLIEFYGAIRAMVHGLG